MRAFLKAIGFDFSLLSTESEVLIANFLQEIWCTYGAFKKKKKNRKTPYYITPYTQHIYIETQKGLLHRHTPTSTDIFSHTHTHCLIIFLGPLFCFSVAPFIFFCPGTPGW